MQHKGLNQLLCAALINSGFRETLLHSPAQALATGYYDQAFSLTPQERDLVLGIKAQHIEDFAAQVHRWILGNGSNNGHDSRRGYGLDGFRHLVGKDNGNGHNQNPLDVTKPFVDLYRAQVPAHENAFA